MAGGRDGGGGRGARGAPNGGGSRPQVGPHLPAAKRAVAHRPPPIPKAPTAVPRVHPPTHTAPGTAGAQPRPDLRTDAPIGTRGPERVRGGGVSACPPTREPHDAEPLLVPPPQPAPRSAPVPAGTDGRSPSEGPPEYHPRRYRDSRSSPPPIPVSVPEPRTAAQPVTCTHLRRFVHLKMAAGSAAGRDRPRFPPPGGAPRAAPPPPSAPTAGRGSGGCGRRSALCAGGRGSSFWGPGLGAAQPPPPGDIGGQERPRGAGCPPPAAGTPGCIESPPETSSDFIINCSDPSGFECRGVQSRQRPPEAPHLLPLPGWSRCSRRAVGARSAITPSAEPHGVSRASGGSPSIAPPPLRSGRRCGHCCGRTHGSVP